MKTVLTIAGSDCSGGAGIQADIKTMTMNGVFAASVITSVTAQNTVGVFGICDLPPEFVKKQIDAVFEDVPPAAVKIGMVSSAPIIEVIAERLAFYGAKNLVVDPVMISTSGSRLLNEDAVQALKTKLFALATVVTPNIPEAETLADMQIFSREDMQAAAKKIGKKFRCAVLCKGGHNANDASDVLFDGKRCVWFDGRRIETENTHGTGCTLSSAIAANMAKGCNLKQAVKKAKDYLSNALADGLDIGKGHGPMNHAFDLKAKYKK